MTWSPELLLDASASREELIEWLDRQFRTLSDWTATAAGGSLVEARGGLLNSSPQSAPNIGIGAWGVIPWGAGMLATPVNVTQDPANNQFSYQVQGVYLFAFWGLLQHDLQTSGRRVYLRFYDATQGQQLGGNLYLTPIHANQTESAFAFTSYLEIPSSIVNNAIQLEIGGLSPVSSLQWTRSGFNLLRAGDL